MKIEQRLLDDIRPYEANPRKNALNPSTGFQIGYAACDG